MKKLMLMIALLFTMFFTAGYTLHADEVIEEEPIEETNDEEVIEEDNGEELEDEEENIIWVNIKETFSDPVRLAGFLVLMIIGGIGRNVNKYFKKGNGTKKLVEMAFGYMIDLFSKGDLTDKERLQKEKLITGVLNTPELQQYFDKADIKIEETLDYYLGRINDLKAKLDQPHIKGEIRDNYVTELERLLKKVAELNEKLT